MLRRALLLPAVLLLVGCPADRASAPATATDADVAPASDAAASDGGATAGACAAAGPVVAKMTTEDGVALEADLYTTGAAKGPGVVLLHMIPPGNDRTNYPSAFIAALVAKGMSVLNVDRRGAGGSGGDAKQAYLGDSGKLDARAAVSFLAAHPCAIDAQRVAIVGASNGSTTALDYAATATTPPRALVFLTGGTYTENQTKLADQRPRLDATPMLFVFSAAESAWSKGFAAGAPAAWVFKEYASGDHGTRMFAAASQSVSDTVDFLAASLAQR